nr:T9SS C-terminal target domain-containing protein [Paracoccus saliphilus]
MKPRFLRALAAVALFLHAPAAIAQPMSERDAARVYVFGNSLIHHLTDTDETTVPHWLAVMARHEGRDLALDGRWGFPRNFATELPPIPNWSFKSVEPAWDADRPFSSAGFDTVILNPENFIQYDRADRPYLGDNPDRATPLGSTLTVVDWVGQNTQDARFMIYEGWADLNPFTDSFPPSDRELQRYYRHAQAGYADWYDDYVARLKSLRRETQVEFIPAGRVMARLLTEEPLSQIPPEALYSDTSPHGTETIYLLAAMITYVSIFGARPPAGLELPDTIDPLFAAAYEQTADRIWDIMRAEAQ